MVTPTIVRRKTSASHQKTNGATNTQSQPPAPTATGGSVFDALNLNSKQQEMLDALRKAFQKDLNQTVAAHTKILEHLASKYEIKTDLPNHIAGDPVLLTNKKTKRTLAVTKDSIEFVGKKGNLWGVNKKFTYAAALEMAEFAALDTDMQVKGGVELTGTRYERALLERAITEVNKSLPKDQQIKVKNNLNRFLRPAKGPIEQQAKKHAKNELTDFKRETPLALPTTATAVASTAAANTTNRQASQRTGSLLSDRQYDALKQHVIDEQKATNGTVKDFFKAHSIGQGNLAATVREATSRLESENFIKVVPHGAATRRVIDLSNFNIAANGSSQPPGSHSNFLRRGNGHAANPA